MKNFSFVILSIVSISSFSQEDGSFNTLFRLSGTNWKSDHHCFSSDTINTYILTTKDDVQWSWGNSIQFADSTFRTDYAAPCGLDCFTSVSGRYRYVGNDQIAIYVETIDRDGFCQNSDTGTQIVQRSYGLYRIEQTENGVKLIREFDQSNPSP